MEVIPGSYSRRLNLECGIGIAQKKLFPGDGVFPFQLYEIGDENG